MKAKRLTVASFVLALAGAAITAFAPLARQEQGSMDAGGSATVTTSSTSLVSSEGAAVLLILAVPVAIALLPVLASHRGVRIASAVLLWGFCVLGMASVGLFFVPAAVVMTIAAARHERLPHPATG